ncbi:MAG TPA: SDR family NAD(P)-dependent oxidoreductase [Candidatus Acidoferrum sp.]|nr:SDR family NAD(P)-dependent oxidoreductase [Candidatus Acidoferrum sp.]
MKQILVVGGGTGLGGAIVKNLADGDRNVIVAGRTKPPAELPIREFHSVDAANADWPFQFSAIEKETGATLDAVIFVAGSGVFGKVNLIPVEKARQIFELNFWACASAARAAAEYWAGKGQPGKFVAILSLAALRAVPLESYYAASKAATARFLECLRLEYGHRRIEFISVFPGLLNTGFRRNAKWYGLKPAFADEGADVHKTAQAVVDLLEGRRRAQVLGWKERTIALADRWLPGFYDRFVLRSRVERLMSELSVKQR